MFDVALQFLTAELNSYFLTETGSDAVTVKLSNIVDDTGKYAFGQEVVGLSLVNLEEERAVKLHLPSYTYVNGQHVVTEPDLRLNLFLMFAANFKIYQEALKYLSYVLLFFQSHLVFSQQDFPGLDARFDRLLLELQSPSYEQWNQIWGFNGTRQLPAAIYKLRMVILQPETPSYIRPPLTTINASILNK